VIFNPRFESPKTAKVTVQYLRPLRTPSAVLCRGWVERVDGRKIWAKAVVQVEDREPVAKGEALYNEFTADRVTPKHHIKVKTGKYPQSSN
jgi:acyl-CoA thioesterase FadM